MISTVETPEQIDALLASGCGPSFAKEAKWAGTFKPAVFKRNWTMFIGQGIGVIFTMTAQDRIAGAIGGLCFPDVNDDEPTSSELFWYVLPEFRGSLDAVRLVDRLEQWAFGKGVIRHSMVRHHATMDERIEKFYVGRGYLKSETIHTKVMR